MLITKHVVIYIYICVYIYMYKKSSVDKEGVDLGGGGDHIKK